jgi:hydrophobic/amphiphilic exporter-1 (mainly G- bacteria), HAE1 family
MSDNRSSSEKTNEYRLAIRRPVATSMLFLILIVFGWRSYQNLPINLMPDISYPSLTVRTEYEGAAPEDVEMLITRPLEELLSIVSGMVEISSISSPGLSEIILEFTWGSDMNLAQQEVRDRLDLFDPPREVTRKPVILRYDPTLDPVMRVAITTSDETLLPGSSEERAVLTAIREAAQRRLKSDLEAEGSIAQARIKGGQEEEIQVLLDVAALKALGIAPQFVIAALAQQNINLSGGNLREGDTEYLVRTLNEYGTIDDVANSIIMTPGGAQRKLFELAEVFLGTKERETIVHINGREAVAIDIFKEGSANTVQVCNKIHDLLGFDRDRSFQERLMEVVRDVSQGASLQGIPGTSAPENATETKKNKGAFVDRLPSSAKLSVISDQSRFIKGAINEVQSATILGGLLALAVLFLFLQEFKSTFIIGLSIPISVIATFVPMFFMNISLNIMSLGGLALGVGMLVDNSIVVLESIFRCREEGDGVRESAERGTREVSGAVIASTLTTICVFLPVAFVEGIAGQLFGDLALSVTFSLSASLLTALYLIPLVASRSTVAVSSDRYVVWLLRAYREGRDSRGQGVVPAVMGIPVLTCSYIILFLKENWQEVFGPAAAAFRAVAQKTGIKTLIRALAALIFLPILLIVFVFRVILGAVTVLFVTMLFLVSSLAYLVFLLIYRLLFILFYVPLRLFASFFEASRAIYGITLRHSLRFSLVVLVLTGLVAAHAFNQALLLGRELMPPMRQGEFGLRMEIRAGSRLEETEARAQKYEDIIRSVPEVDTVTVEVGRERRSMESDRGENVAEFTVLLKDPEQIAMDQDVVIEGLREKLLAATVDENIAFTLPTLFSFRSAIEIQIVGDSLAELRRYGQAATVILNEIEGVTDAELSIRPGYPELIIEMDRDLLSARGLSPGEVAKRLRAEIQGEVATRFSRGADRVDIRVRADQKMLLGLDDLRNLSVTDGPIPIPLNDVAIIRVEEGPSEIRRIGQRRTAIVSANVEQRDLASVSKDIDERLKELNLPKDMYYLQSGQRRELDTAFKSLRFALLLALFLVYVVMACQFESIIQPALVMFAVPLAFIGVIYALMATGTNISVMVFLGGIILAGIVVNDAIILVDYINQLRARGMSKQEAIVEAGKTRLRPIIMTTVTSVLGLLPMLIASGDGAEMRRPMALTVVAGLSMATLLTLYIIPMAYNLFGGKDRS